MRLIFFLFALLFMARLHAQQETELVKKIKTKLDKVTDYKAEGSLSMNVPFIDIPTSDVTIYFKKPDKFTVKKSGGISILPKGGVSMNPGTLLINEKYEVVPGKDAIVNGITTKVVKLLPLDDNGDVVLTTLYIDQKNMVVRKAIVNTRENGAYEIEMSYGKFINWGLPDKVVFSFNSKDYKLPKGITFEYEKGGKKKAQTTKNQKGTVTIVYSGYLINKGVSDKIFAGE